MTSPEMKDPITLPREVEPELVDWFTQFIDRYVDETNGPDTDALIACLDRVRDSYRQSLASSPQVGGEPGESITRVKQWLARHPIDREAGPPVHPDDVQIIFDLALAALSQDPEVVAWRLVNDHGGETITREHPGEWPNHTVQRLIVHPSDRGGEVKG